MANLAIVSDTTSGEIAVGREFFLADHTGDFEVSNIVYHSYW